MIKNNMYRQCELLNWVQTARAGGGVHSRSFNEIRRVTNVTHASAHVHAHTHCCTDAHTPRHTQAHAGTRRRTQSHVDAHAGTQARTHAARFVQLPLFSLPPIDLYSVSAAEDISSIASGYLSFVSARRSRKSYLRISMRHQV